MKVGFPVLADQGLDSPLSGHFGSAPYFAVADTDSGVVRCLANANAVHEHGSCSPFETLRGEALDALVVGGIGRGAIAALRAAGIRVLRGGAPTVHGCLIQLSRGELEELTADDACAGHAHETAGGGCGRPLPVRG